MWNTSGGGVNIKDDFKAFNASSSLARQRDCIDESDHPPVYSVPITTRDNGQMDRLQCLDARMK
jgi:hypothetical protein